MFINADGKKTHAKLGYTSPTIPKWTTNNLNTDISFKLQITKEILVNSHVILKGRSVFIWSYHQRRKSKRKYW